MAQRLHTNELLDEYLRLFEVDLKATLSLKSVIRGHLDWMPPEAVPNLVNGIWVAPTPSISISRAMLPKELQITYNFRIVYVRKILLNENVNKVKVNEMQTIVEKLIDKYNLPDMPDLPNGQLLWSFPTSVEPEPMEDTFVQALADDLVATAFNVEAVTRTNHRL